MGVGVINPKVVVWWMLLLMHGAMAGMESSIPPEIG